MSLPRVTLYTKDDCSLCEIVEEELAALRQRYPHELVTVDITAERDLFLKYRYIIPVVAMGDESLHAPITTAQLADLLKRSAASSL